MSARAQAWVRRHSTAKHLTWRVQMRLAALADDAGVVDEATVEGLYTWLRCSERTVQRALRWLEAAGELQGQPRRGAAGGYRLLLSGPHVTPDVTPDRNADGTPDTPANAQVTKVVDGGRGGDILSPPLIGVWGFDRDPPSTTTTPSGVPPGAAAASGLGGGGDRSQGEQNPEPPAGLGRPPGPIPGPAGVPQLEGLLERLSPAAAAVVRAGLDDPLGHPVAAAVAVAIARRVTTAAAGAERPRSGAAPTSAGRAPAPPTSRQPPPAPVRAAGVRRRRDPHVRPAVPAAAGRHRGQGPIPDEAVALIRAELLEVDADAAVVEQVEREARRITRLRVLEGGCSAPARYYRQVALRLVTEASTRASEIPASAWQPPDPAQLEVMDRDVRQVDPGAERVVTVDHRGREQWERSGWMLSDRQHLAVRHARGWLDQHLGGDRSEETAVLLEQVHGPAPPQGLQSA